MAKKAVVGSACECQGKLGAELNEARTVLRGWVKDPRHGDELPAPCHSINAASEYFQLGWLCPLCGRNTLRSFYAGSLRYPEATPSATAPVKAAEDAGWG